MTVTKKTIQELRPLVDRKWLSEKTGISYGRMCRIFRGKTELTVENSEAIARALACVGLKYEGVKE